MVSLFGLEIRRKKDKASPRSGYALTDDDRAAAIAVRELRQQRQQLIEETRLLQETMRLEKQKAELEDLRDELHGYYEEDEEEAPAGNLEGMLLPILMAGLKPQAPQQEGVPASVVAKTHFTDDEIKNMLAGVPSFAKKKFKKMDDQTLHKMILSYMPNIDDDTIHRALAILKA